VVLAILANNSNIKIVGKYRDLDLGSVSEDSAQLLTSFAAVDRSNQLDALEWLKQHDEACHKARRIARRATEE
jgi:hypothetical protein